MQLDLLFRYVIPGALFCIMLSVGLAVVLADFRRVIQRPKALVIGIICQMLLLPIVAYLVANLFPLQPELAVGLMIIAFCPGGAMSNAFALMMGGDVALSIVLTTFVSLTTPFTIPLLTQATMNHFLGSAQNFTLPIGSTITQLLLITVIPVTIGVIVNQFNPRVARRIQPTLKVVSITLLFTVVGGLLIHQWPNLAQHLAQVGPATLALNIATMGVGYFVAQHFYLNRAAATTISIEVGIQNGATATFVTGTILQSAILSISPIIYSQVMIITVLLFGVMIKRGQRATHDAESALAEVVSAK